MTGGMDFPAFNGQLIEQFRARGGVGELGPVHFEQLVLLTTTGRRSGQPHTVPIGGVRDGDAVLLFAYDKWIAHAPHVAEHQARAGRQIPMVRVPLG